MPKHKSRIISSVLMVLLLLVIACGGGAGETSTPTTTSTTSTTSSTSTQPVATAVAETSTAEETVTAEATETASSYADVPDGTMLENGAIVLGGVLYGGVVNGFGEEPQYGGIAIFSHRRDLPSSDPMFSGTISTHNVGGSMWGRGNLLRVKRENNFQIEGFLAESYEANDDFKEWTFKLHPNITWHDGTPFDADAMAYWINLSTNPPEGRRPANFAITAFQDLEKVEVLDKLTIKLTLDSGQPNWPEALSLRGTVVTHPEHLVKDALAAGDFKHQPNQHEWVALGPFKFDSYDKGSVAKVRRYEGYFEKDAQGRALPFMDGIDFVIIRDAGAMVSAFRARRLDGTSRGAGFGVRPEFQETIVKDLGDKAWFSRVLYVGWGQKPNTLKPPWDDIELRKAVSLFFDRDKVSILALGGSSVPGAMWTPGSQWANKDVPTWPGMNPATKEEDRATAMKILKDNGWEGMKTEILCRDIYIYLCEGWDGQMREMGFDNFLKMLDTTSLTELTATGQYTQYFTANTGAMPSAKYSAFCSIMCNSRSHNHDDLKVDELFDKIVSTADPVERNKLTQEVERYVMKDMYYTDSWFHEVVVLAYRDRIKGVPGPQMNVHDNTDMATTWIDSSIPR